MSRIMVLSCILAMAAAAQLWAQTPVPDPDTVPPVQEGDPAVRHLPPRLDYIEERQRITPEEVPDQVRETLESSAKYAGWEKAMVFFDKNTEEYFVEFKDAGKTTTFRFNREGRPIMEE